MCLEMFVRWQWKSFVHFAYLIVICVVKSVGLNMSLCESLLFFLPGKSSTGHCKESILELHLYHLVLNWLILSHIQLSVNHPIWNLLSPTWEIPKCCWKEQTVSNASVFPAWLLHACSCIYTSVFLITAIEVTPFW